MLYPENAVLLAPLSDYTDYPFRRACREQTCRYAFTPLVDAGSLAYDRPAGKILLYRGADEPWLGVQLLGANPKFIEAAVRKINDYAFELLDFNMGCPMPKVTCRGAGAALGLDLVTSCTCLELIVRLSRFPVTAKIRILDPDNPEPTVAYAKALEQTGIQALTVHGRVWQAIYAGPVAAPVIRAVRESVKIPVIANGGVFDRASAEWLRRETGCSRIMIARGAIGNPWIFRDLHSPAPPAPPDLAEWCRVVEAQVRHMIEFYGENAGLRCSRKLIHGFMKGRGIRHTLRDQVSHLATAAEFAEFLETVRQSHPGRLQEPA